MGSWAHNNDIMRECHPKIYMSFSETYNDSSIFKKKSRNTLWFYEGSSEAFAPVAHWYLWELHVLCSFALAEVKYKKCLTHCWQLERRWLEWVRPSCKLMNVPVMHLITWFRLCGLKSKPERGWICRRKWSNQMDKILGVGIVSQSNEWKA